MKRGATQVARRWHAGAETGARGARREVRARAGATSGSDRLAAICGGQSSSGAAHSAARPPPILRRSSAVRQCLAATKDDRRAFE